MLEMILEVAGGDDAASGGRLLVLDELEPTAELGDKVPSGVVDGDTVEEAAVAVVGLEVVSGLMVDDCEEVSCETATLEEDDDVEVL